MCVTVPSHEAKLTEPRGEADNAHNCSQDFSASPAERKLVSRDSAEVSNAIGCNGQLCARWEQRMRFSSALKEHPSVQTTFWTTNNPDLKG